MSVLAEEEHDFRLTNWGMSPEQVMQQEKLTLSHDDTLANDVYVLIYTVNILGKEGIVEYGFKNRALREASLIFYRKSFSSDNEYAFLFEALKQSLIDSYGESNDNSWQLSRTTIYLKNYGDQFSVYYFDRGNI